MKCKNETCNNETREGYTYCPECYNKWKTNTARTPDKEPKKTQWHDDPIVDQLMKINSNLKNIAETLKELKKND